MKNSSVPSEYAQDLWATVEARLPIASIRRLADLLEKNGLWAPLDPINQEGQNLAEAWLTRLTTSSHWVYDLDEESLEWLLVSTKGAIDWEKSARGDRSSSLGMRLLSAANNAENQKSLLWSERLWQQYPLSMLRAFGRTRGESGSSSDYVFRSAVAHGQVGVAKILMSKGWGWIGPNGENLGSSIKTPGMWEFFLETNGNPKGLVPSSKEEDPVVPLWKYLLSVHVASDIKDEFREKIRAWVTENEKDSLDKEDLARYWEKLGSYGTLATVQQSIRSRKDWPTLTNERGESPIFVGMREHMGVIASFGKQTKAAEAFRAVDKQGWNLWHHMLAIGKKMSVADCGVAKSLGIKVRQAGGKGILPTLVDNSGKKFSYHQALPSRDVMDWMRKEGFSQEDWWEGSHEDQEKLANVLLGPEAYLGGLSNTSPGKRYFSRSDFRNKLSQVVHNFPPTQTMHPRLLGALALNELLGRSNPESAPVFDRLCSLGASLEGFDSTQEEWKVAILNMEAEQATRYQSLFLETVLPSAVTDSSRGTPAKIRF